MFAERHARGRVGLAGTDVVVTRGGSSRLWIMDGQSGNGGVPHSGGGPSGSSPPPRTVVPPFVPTTQKGRTPRSVPVALPAPARASPTIPPHASPAQPEPPPVAVLAHADPAPDGTLAAYLERVVARTAAAFNVAAAVITLVGDDRRCFVGGSAPPPWLARDPGALMRSRACAKVLESGEPVAVEDASVTQASVGASVSAMLGVPAYMIAPLPRMATGQPAGVLCVFANAPRVWSTDEINLLADQASATAPALTLRRRTDATGHISRRPPGEGLHDALTGLPNRVLFMERLMQAVVRSRREHAPFAVILFDLDHFRTINESLGHAAGDALLVAVAQRLGDCARAGDTVARLGADEFALLMHRITHAADAARVTERIQAALATSIDVTGYDVFTSASFGIALETGGAAEPEHLLRSADLALGNAKRAGRARFVVFDRVMHAEALARLQLETELQRAAEREAFVLHYQPIVSLATGRLASVEALVRWEHDERGLVPPAAFIAAAEATGIIIPVGRWVLTAACRQLRAWHTAFPEWQSLGVAVNVSVRQLQRPDFVDMVSRVVRECQLPPRCLVLELTESTMIEPSDLVLGSLTALRRLGVRVHLDDFGTGHSSLALLDRLPLDGVKIDRAFVQMLGREERAAQFVRAMVALAQGLRRETVAEGVTTDAQLQELRALSCTYGQGYLFAVPQDAATIEQMLRG
jgi:diguanylate cyclase (GGDEF)-like protein